MSARLRSLSYSRGVFLDSGQLSDLNPVLQANLALKVALGRLIFYLDKFADARVADKLADQFVYQLLLVTLVW